MVLEFWQRNTFVEISEVSGAKPFSFMSNGDLVGFIVCTSFLKKHWDIQRAGC